MFSTSAAGELRIRQVMGEHYGFVWRSLRRLGVSDADTDDAAQEVFLIFARRQQDVTPERTRAFLFGTAVRIASNRRRGRRRSPEEPLPEIEELSAHGGSPEELSELSGARRQLQSILEGMTLEQRAAFMLCELEELTAPAAAELLAVPVGTVNSRLRAAREVFHAALRRLDGARGVLRSKA